MRVSIVDRLEIGDTAPTGDGYLAVNAKIARIGLYQYARSEIGDTEGDPNELVNVYRPETEVFDKDAMASFAHKPITLNHPRDAVGKDNWRKYTRGMSGGRVARVGDFLEIPMVVNDGEAITAIENGTRQLSAGYSASITIGDNVTPEGEPYRAIMSDIRGNHIAIVAQGRAGSQCRIGDAAWPTEDITDSPATAEKWLRKAIALHEKHMNGTAPTTGAAGEKSQMLMMTQMKNALSELAGEKVKPKMKMGDTTTHTETLVKDAKKMPSLILDGLKVDLSDEEAVSAAFKKLTDAKAAAEAATATALSDKATAEAVVATAATANVAAIEAKDAEIATLTAAKATLEAELADARDPAKLRDAAAAYSTTVAKAKSLGAEVADNASEADVKKAAVSLKLGDVAANWTDAQVDVSFATLTASVADAKPDAFRDAMANRQPIDFADAAAKAKAAREAMIAGFNAPRDAAK